MATQNPLTQQLFGGPKNPFASKKPTPPKQPPKKQFDYGDLFENPMETIKKTPNKIIHGATEEGKNIFKASLGQLFGEMKPGQEVKLGKGKQAPPPEAPKPETSGDKPHINYIAEVLQSGEKARSQELQSIRQEVQNIIQELRGLAASAGELQKQVTEATGSTVVNPGVYHRSFFRHLLSLIKDAREKIENAGTWLQAMRGKQKRGLGQPKKKSNNTFWGKVKKGGTQYLMSGEHSTSRNAG